jgi:hypothetical protein
MLAEDIDFHEIFKINPTTMALFTADLDFIDANDEFLRAVGHPIADLVGRNAFAVLPKMPYEPGNPKWTALEAAMTSGRRAVHKLTRYDIEDPACPGAFRERYWSSVVTPLTSLNGRLDVLELSAREVTPIIEQYRALRVGPDEP